MTKSMRIKEEKQVPCETWRLLFYIGDEMFAFLPKETFLSEPDVFALHLGERVGLCYSGCHRERKVIFTGQHKTVSLWGVN